MEKTDSTSKEEDKITSNNDNGNNNKSNSNRVSVFERLKKKVPTVQLPPPEPVEKEKDENKEEIKNSIKIDQQKKEKTFQSKSIEIPHNTSKVIHITGLKRPFTPKELLEMLKSKSKFESKNFWLNSNKSECAICYDTIDDAISAYKRLYGICWPTKIIPLTVEFSNKSFNYFTSNNNNNSQITSPANNTSKSYSISSPKTTNNIKVIDPEQLFKKTVAKPSIFYLPLNDIEINEMKRKMRMPDKEDAIPYKRR